MMNSAKSSQLKCERDCEGRKKKPKKDAITHRKTDRKFILSV